MNPKLEKTEEDEGLCQQIAGNTYNQMEDISDSKIVLRLEEMCQFVHRGIKKNHGGESHK